ncbi:MAG TPA: hypothetical protein VF092_20635 [Longimicrobium sp.]
MQTRIPILLSTAAALACAAIPARAQTAAGPARHTLAAARLRGPVLVPAAAPDPNAALAAQVEPSKPRLYFSIPFSAAAAFAGAAVGYGASFAGLDCSDEGPTCGGGPDNAEYLGAYAGMSLGAALGAHLGGLRHDSKGGFLATLGGAAVGALPILVADKESDAALETGAIVGLATSTAGAVLVDYLVRHPRH